ncbi:hypothetical protein FOL47_006226, partial [Perkinsus chesapeaki]
GSDFWSCLSLELVFRWTSSGKVEACLGAAAVPLKPSRSYSLESCEVREYLDIHGDTCVVLECPDCIATRTVVRHGSSVTYEWEVAWRWAGESPPDSISCPEEYSLSRLTADQLVLLNKEIDVWIRDGWLIPVPEDQE